MTTRLNKVNFGKICALQQTHSPGGSNGTCQVITVETFPSPGIVMPVCICGLTFPYSQQFKIATMTH